MDDGNAAAGEQGVVALDADNRWRPIRLAQERRVSGLDAAQEAGAHLRGARDVAFCGVPAVDARQSPQPALAGQVGQGMQGF